MASKLETFLNENKIDTRRLLATSRQIERLRPEDRAIKLKQSQARKSEDGKKPEGLDKPRSGRPVTERGLRTALAGESVSGPQKTRILRAVNTVSSRRRRTRSACISCSTCPRSTRPSPRPKSRPKGPRVTAATRPRAERRAAGRTVGDRWVAYPQVTRLSDLSYVS